MAEERARALLAAQLPLADKRALADVVVDNGGAPESLEPELTRAWTEVEQRCAARRAARGV
jgi:dephospho-CoA kinase